MDPILAILAAGYVAVVSGGVAWVKYAQSRDLNRAASKFGFDVAEVELADKYFRKKGASGEYRGVSARFGYLHASSTQIDLSKQKSGGQKHLYHLVAGVELQIGRGYFMSRDCVVPGELHHMERVEGLAPVQNPRLESNYFVMEDPGAPIPAFRSTRVVELMDELARTYGFVRYFGGWLWLGNPIFDLDNLDVDFDNLVEARSKILESAGGS